MSNENDVKIREPGELRVNDRIKVVQEDYERNGAQGTVLEVFEHSAHVRLDEYTTSTGASVSGETAMIPRDYLRRVFTIDDMAKEFERERPQLHTALDQLRTTADGAARKIAQIENAEHRAKIAEALGLASEIAQRLIEHPSIATLPALLPSAARLRELIEGLIGEAQ